MSNNLWKLDGDRMIPVTDDDLKTLGYVKQTDAQEFSATAKRLEQGYYQIYALIQELKTMEYAKHVQNPYIERWMVNLLTTLESIFSGQAATETIRELNAYQQVFELALKLSGSKQQLLRDALDIYRKEVL